MPKKDMPLFFLFVFLVAFCTIATSDDVSHVAKKNSDTRFTQTASASRAVSGTPIRMSESEQTLLTKHSERVGGSAKISTLSGRIEAYYYEPGKGKETDRPLRFALISGKDVYELRNLGGELPSAIDGASVEITGIISTTQGGNELLVNINEVSAKSIRGVHERISGGGASVDREGNQCTSFCVLVIPVDMSGDTTSLPTQTEIHDYIFSGRIMDAIYKESYGAVVYGGDVMDWIPVSGQGVSLFFAPGEVEQYLSNNSIDINNYDQIVYLTNGGVQAYDGEATIGATTFYLNGISYNMPVARVGFAHYANNANLTVSNGNLSYFDYLYVHETGHNFNALHDDLLNCQMGPMSLPSQCLSVDKGNKYSLMGYGDYGGHFSMMNKLRAGWVGLGNITMSNNTTHTPSPIENPNPTFLGIDGTGNAIPEFVVEKRVAAGLDMPNLFTDINLNGTFLYRLKNPLQATTDVFTWDLELVDTTPAVSSNTWFNSLQDAVFKIPQRYGDIQNNTRFSQRLDGNNNTVQVLPGLGVVNACTRSGVKAFEPYANQGDVFTGQIPAHKWPVRTGTPSVAAELVQDIHVDVNNPDAQIFLYKNIMLFNDDYIGCGPGQYTFEFIANDVSLPLLSESTATYGAWSGPHFNYVMAYLPVTGMTYGQHTITLKITKINDGSIFSRPLVFNLVP